MRWRVKESDIISKPINYVDGFIADVIDCNTNGITVKITYRGVVLAINESWKHTGIVIPEGVFMASGFCKHFNEDDNIHNVKICYIDDKNGIKIMKALNNSTAYFKNGDINMKYSLFGGKLRGLEC
jgi:hypothetical protein